MTPHETGSTATPGVSRAALPPRTFSPQGPTLPAPLKPVQIQR